MKSTVDWSTKGLWLPDGDVPDAAFAGAGHHLFDGPFTWPIMVAKRSAIEANIATMAAYCRRHGVEFAPHGKTTMAPTLFAAQLAAGAWGITVATANQALAARHFGVPRVLLANELLDPRVLRWAAGEVASGWEFLYYVDSLAGVAVLREALEGTGGRLSVLVEMGYPGGRTGCRTVLEALAVAEAAARIPGVKVAGVAGFEGLLPDADAVRAFLATMQDFLVALSSTGVGAPLVLSAGGSAYFDAVLDSVTGSAQHPEWTVILRSGAVVSHDNGTYASSSPFVRSPEEGSLVAALEVWAQVLSTPEPGLAILGAGKRDLAFDIGLPVPVEVRGTDATVRPLPGASIAQLNDQHAYLRDAAVTPGELVRLGISHPCTAFDKWRVIPVVTDAYEVVDLLHTYF
jgi:D-serine deaminase-like pyridoxal phosphate-dependent protein